MSKQVASWVVLGLGATLASAASAQTEPAAASGSLSLSSSDGAKAAGSADAATPAATPAATAAPAEAPFEPYEPGLPPEGNVLELGVFSGIIFPSSDHNLRYERYPQQEYKVAPEFGARIGYYPLSFLGIEAEAMGATSKIKNTQTAAMLYAVRGQLVVQAPTPYVAPRS